MAQPLPPEPPRLPEAPDRPVGLADPEEDGHPHIRLLQEPPERKVTGPRPRPGLRQRPALDDTPLPARGVGMTITSYLIAGLLAYGLIGWLIGRALHLEILTAVGMLIGLVISISLIIYRYGRSTPPRIRRFAPQPARPNEPSGSNEQNGLMTPHDQTTTRREELTGDR
jgi:ATP synthase protein I